MYFHHFLFLVAKYTAASPAITTPPIISGLILEAAGCRSPEGAGSAAVWFAPSPGAGAILDTIEVTRAAPIVVAMFCNIGIQTEEEATVVAVVLTGSPDIPGVYFLPKIALNMPVSH